MEYVFQDFVESCPKDKRAVTITQERVYPSGTQGFKVITATCDSSDLNVLDCSETCSLLERYSHSNF